MSPSISRSPNKPWPVTSSRRSRGSRRWPAAPGSPSTTWAEVDGMIKGDVPAKGKHAPDPAAGAGHRGHGDREPAGAPAPIDDSLLRDYLADALSPEASARVEKALRDSAELRARL